MTCSWRKCLCKRLYQGESQIKLLMDIALFQVYKIFP